ncbi:sortase [Phycicoccus sp. Root563]|uniref:class E sortase n=1 Tax=unclassified Phycicoccus TaxID=2637926 RepID=UPI000702EAA1|nr:MULTISPECIES: class E sortase [unclassified Phycicoccus]KQU68255.1 sortase [Phycicoccus sp. Root101]KQZ89813.1 sortase [Phycicoccus sp. Root563]
MSSGAARAGRWVLGLAGDVFVTAGLLLLLFVGWQLWWTDVTANRVQDDTVHALTRDFASGASGSAAANRVPAAVPFGKAFAIVRIPRLGADYARPVLEGTSRDILMDGVGHYTGTARPGAVGNFAIAGHRTTYGRPFHDIDLLRAGDKVVIETRTEFHVYAVKRHVIVAPTEVDVIAPVPQKVGTRPTQRWLTMTACHPKYSAAQRYVVFAELVRSYPRAAGLPADVLAAPKAGA